ncbi:EthD domain-containing protein [Aldersonia kunmingensis]|uniref:EthD domain-containing protein n=1 Tax=Aldersonia kunmingensis TaxID=408066 RepID=UPI000A0199D1|nr:EthD domain-containing protein [Aldersonia kunmingensis]
MTKSMFLLWATGSETDWNDRLRVRLTALASSPGIERIQLNVTDAAVADAMLRLSTFDAPVSAVVSVWSESAGAAAAVGAELEALSERVAGYEVSETIALAPPQTPRGERADALTNIALLRRPAELEQDEWLRRWQGDHTQVAIDVQGTFGYIQNVVTRACTASAPPVDGIVEEHFPMAALQDPHAFYGSAGDNAELARRLTMMTDSIEKFGADRNIDVIPTSCYVF